MKRFIFVAGSLFYLAMLSGCMTFTQEEYDLQEKKYERDRKVEEQKAKDSIYLKW